MWHEPYTVAFLCKIAAQSEGKPISKVFANMMEMSAKLSKEHHEFSNSKLMDMSLFTYPFVQSKLEEEEPGKTYLFVKEMAISIVNQYEFLPNVPTRHTFLIRHPYRFLSSRRKMYLRMTKSEGNPEDFDMRKAAPKLMRDLYKQDGMYMLWKYVQESGRDPNPIVIDADEVVNQPDIILQKYFAELGIPFHDKYLRWEESLDSVKEWKGALGHVVWGYRKGIFDKAIKSSCFIPSTYSRPKREDLTSDIVEMADSILPGYEEMYKWRIKPT
ncbi:hypothetical protein HOLleu_06130 [Holothuria leucospilota]|uniref:Uncharacterized protein n=1 Tax=Holothuria leucospilota TaxID=206669 RepID=A0A9Q1CKH5_HOLLE|nr:hypothetical protein HOLleu_06130 [Holothuria leucospilota]